MNPELAQLNTKRDVARPAQCSVNIATNRTNLMSVCVDGTCEKFRNVMNSRICVSYVSWCCACVRECEFVCLCECVLSVTV